MQLTALLALTATLFAAPAVHAQLPGGDLLTGITPTCLSSVTYLVQSDFGTCANLFSAIPILTASGSLVGPSKPQLRAPRNSWLDTVCQQDGCAPALIENATNIVEQGCKADIEDGNALVSSLVPIVTNFNSIKEGLCLRWRDNGTFCVTSQLEDLQSVLGSDLTLSALTNFNAADLESYPREQACDDCSHALTTKFQPLIANNNSLFSGIGQTIQNYCGDAFLDGQMPSTVLAQNDSSSSNGTAGGEEAAATPASSATMAKSVGFGTAAVALLAAVALV